MALTLASGISASDRYCTVNQPPTQPPGSYYRIGDEVVQHIGYVTTTPIWTPNFTRLYIARAQLGTTAASHLSAAALTYVRPEFLSATAETDPGPFETGGAGGGGVTVTDGTVTVAATSLALTPGSVVDAGSGVADVDTMPPPWTVGEHGTLTIQPDDVNADCLVLKDASSNVIARFAQTGLTSNYPPLSVDTGGTIILGLKTTGSGFRLAVPADGTGLFGVGFDGATDITPLPDAGGGLTVYSPATGVPFWLLRVAVADGSTAFAVAGDGTVHIKTGTSIVADL